MAGICMATFLNSVFKLAFHEPRPTWVWTDVSPLGCAGAFGLPSGHSCESSNFVFILLLDQFAASKWSREAYPSLNTKTPTNSPMIFVVMLLFAFTYWPLVVFDRVVLGKHTLNQVLLGS